jgi:Cas7 group CRISPR-associated protein Csh2
MGNEIKRATGLLVVEVVNSNPNGDPDRESNPRQRPNGIGDISPVSFKRKLRDLLEDTSCVFFRNLPGVYSEHPDNYRILESRGRVRNDIMQELFAGQHLSEKNPKFDQNAFLESPFVKKYWDARIFGNTFLEKVEDSAGDSAQVKSVKKGFIKTGVVQFGVGVSLSPVNIIMHTNTSKPGVQEGKSAGMAPLGFRIVEHGVYCMPFFANPNYAGKTGCTADDIALLKLLIPQAYDLNRSAIRPDVRMRHAWYIEHTNPLGSCPDYLLLEALTPVRIGDATEPSTSWSDYQDKTGLPEELRARVESTADLAAQ